MSTAARRIRSSALVVAPIVVASTGSLFASGVAVVATGSRGLLLGLHKVSFVVWLAAMGVHVLWHLWKLPRLALDRSPGRGLRLAAVAGAVACGFVLAVVTVPLADHSQDRATAALGIDSA